MALCTKCGHLNRDGIRFCTACGTKLEDVRGEALARLTLVGPEESSTSHLLSDRPVHLLSDRPVSIGRAASNDVVVDEEHISQRHARVFHQEGVFWVEDLQSTNGTYVNGARIEEATRLTTGDLLKVGVAILRFELLGP